MADITSACYSYPDGSRNEHRIALALDWLDKYGIPREGQFFVPLGKSGDDYTARIVPGAEVASRAGKHMWWGGGELFEPAYHIMSNGRIESALSNRIELPFGDYDAILEDGVVYMQALPAPTVEVELPVRLRAAGFYYLLTAELRELCQLKEGEKVYFDKKLDRKTSTLTLTRGSKKGSGRPTAMVTNAKLLINPRDAGWVSPTDIDKTRKVTVTPGHDFKVVLGFEPFEQPVNA
ncbi:hypothetical protein Pan1_70 [Pseudanabaena phage Pan1]|nr:hypothetical protein Pan1_70 [Pseudanabaena phage Pan1]